MIFQNANAELFVPDGSDETAALARTTHLAIAAHQDDIEIIAIDGILRCFSSQDRRFGGVVLTDGAGSPRAGAYRNFSDQEMQAIRQREQKKAALVGDYSVQILLNYPSSDVKDTSNADVVADLVMCLRATRPEVVYTHNLADKHNTHVAVALRVIESIRQLPGADRPKHLYGGEAWRDLDWLVDTDKIVFHVSERENLQAALLGVFDSQISGGKRYDLATLARRRAHATFFASHVVDQATGLAFAMDLTPLIQDDSLDAGSFVQSLIDHFAEDVQKRLAAFGQKSARGKD